MLDQQQDVRLPESGRQEIPEWMDFAHTGPGTLAGRFMRGFWHPVYRAQDLPAGRAKPVKIMNEEFTLYRGESGEVHAVAFRCAHRGTQLSTGWVEGETLRCFYHGWAYGPDGQCVEQPAEPEPFCNRIKIRNYPVEEYLGLIFVYQGEGEPPPLQRYPDLEQEGVLRILTYVRICNFFNNVENGLDPAHVPFTHGGGRDFGPSEASAMRVQESEFGVNTHRDRTRGPIQVNQYGMPNILLRKNSRPGEDALAWRVPIDDETHVSFAVDRLHRAGDMTECQVLVDTEPSGKDTVNEISLRIMAGELHPDDLKGDRNLFNIQDTVTQAGQGAIADRTAEHLGRSDLAILKIRELWTRELQALAEGRPLKEWRRTRPATVEPTGA